MNLTTSAVARQAAPDLDEEVVHLVTGGYTHEKNADYWQTRPVTVAARLAEVGASLGVWFAGGLASGAAGISTDPKRRAGRLNEILTRLGPAYIKIGQAVSSRPDVLSPEMLTELEKLQDQLPPFPTEDALRVIEQEYGRPYQSVFREISPSPVAAASLGQVYKGVLRDSDETVAIKVQRPGVATSISLDALVLRRLAKEVRKWRKLNTNLPLLIDEWAASLFKELDYRQEARNGIKFKELYSHLEGVYVPGMYPELTTRRVLVMEWIDGINLKVLLEESSCTRRGPRPSRRRTICPTRFGSWKLACGVRWSSCSSTAFTTRTHTRATCCAPGTATWPTLTLV